MFTCNKCGKIFARKYTLDRHKNTMHVGGSKTNKKNLSYECKKCGKDFNRNDSMKRHFNNCKVNINRIKNTGNRNNAITGKKINSINNSDNSKIINIEKLVLINFAKDGTSNLSKDELIKLFKTNKNYIEDMISLINFNPKKPQHHNVYYPDTKSSYGVVYENKKWISKKIDEILDLLLDAKLEDLNDMLNEMGDFLNKKTRNKIKETIENFDYSKPNARKKLKSYLKAILNANKDIIIKTRKLTEQDKNQDQ